ncbi:MAG: fimbrillin family protein [Bacteroidales bacterium]|nr:fimbrillin family protein [Bacteroidales bacterium]
MWLIRRILITIIVAFVTILSSCIKDEPVPVLVDDGTVMFVCEDAQPDTKTTLNGLQTEWVANKDTVGLFSPHASIESDGSPGVINLPLTALTSGERSVFQGSVYWGVGEHVFYSYYPFKEGNLDFEYVPVSLPGIQIQSEGDNSDHIAQLDFLVSKPSVAKYPGISGSDAAISLRYNHVFTVLEFKIRNNSGTGSITKIKLRGLLPLAFESGTINLAQEVPSQGNSYIINEITDVSSEVVLSLETPITPTNDYSTTPRAYMVILPWNTPSSMTLVLEIDGVVKEIIKSDVTFQRGKKYSILVDIDNTEPPIIHGSDLQPVTIAGVTWAPLNVGYDENNRYGLYYQWHRRFGHSYGTTNQENCVLSLAEGNSTEYSNVFLTNFIDPYNWCDSSYVKWDMSEMYNPCPEGWRIPTYEEFEALSSMSSIGVLAGAGGVDGLPGRWMACSDLSNTSQSIFLPAAGYIRFSGESRNINAHGYYWTVDTVSVMARALRISPVSYGNTGMYKGMGNSVRCVKK